MPTGWAIPSPQATTNGVAVSLEYVTHRYRPGLETVSDAEGLHDWLLDVGASEDDLEWVDAMVEESGIDFPLHDIEVTEILSYLSLTEQIGTLRLTSADGVEWESVYTPD